MREKVVGALGGVVGVTFVLLACGSSDDGGSPAAPSGGDGGEEASVVVGVPATIALTAPDIRVWQGRTTTLTVKIARQGPASPVDVTLVGLPSGVTAKPARAALDQDQVDVELTVDADPTKSTVTTTKGIEVRGASDAATATATFALRVTGAPGSFDTTFGPNGTGRTSMIGLLAAGESVEARGIALEPSGGFFVVYDVALTSPALHHEFAIVRFDADGKVDSGFGTNGILRSGVDQIFPRGMVRLSDGKLLVFGNVQVASSYRLMLARVRPDGTFDPTFGGTPKLGIKTFASIDVGAVPTDELGAAAVFTQGGVERIALAGRSGNHGLVAQVTTDGSFDPTFATVGYSVTSTGAANDAWSGTAIAAAADGTRYVTWERSPGNVPHTVMAQSYTGTGAANAAFNSGVAMTVGFTFMPGGQRLTLLPDGRLLALFAAGTLAAPELALKRFGLSGAGDTTYVPQFPISNGSGYTAAGIAVGPDGRVVVACDVVNPAGMILSRVLPAGTLDPFYGYASSGSSTLAYEPTPKDYPAYGVATMLPDGRMIVGGINWVARAWD